MIIGYQIKNSTGQFWGEGNANTVLSNEFAIKDLLKARNTSPELEFSMVAVLQGDIQEPILVYTKEEPINTDEELMSLAEEFDGETALSNPTDIASLKTIDVARKLVQQSTTNYSIVVPDKVDCIWAGDGTGEWIPALIFIPNHVIWPENH